MLVSVGIKQACILSYNEGRKVWKVYFQSIRQTLKVHLWLSLLTFEPSAICSRLKWYINSSKEQRLPHIHPLDCAISWLYPSLIHSWPAKKIKWRVLLSGMLPMLFGHFYVSFFYARRHFLCTQDTFLAKDKKVELFHPKLRCIWQWRRVQVGWVEEEQQVGTRIEKALVWRGLEEDSLTLNTLLKAFSSFQIPRH